MVLWTTDKSAKYQHNTPGRLCMQPKKWSARNLIHVSPQYNLCLLWFDFSVFTTHLRLLAGAAWLHTISTTCCVCNTGILDFICFMLFFLHHIWAPIVDCSWHRDPDSRQLTISGDNTTYIYLKHFMFKQPSDVVILISLSCNNNILRTYNEVHLFNIFNNTLCKSENTYPCHRWWGHLLVYHIDSNFMP